MNKSADQTNANEWYAEGLSFNCTMCGNCCTGPPGTVRFTTEERRAMAHKLGIDEQSFLKKYAHKVGGRWSLNERRTEYGLDCILLDRETIPGKAICSVYEARPKQCRTWPFWPSNLRSRKTWDEVKRNTPCPGMNSGKLIPIEEIRIQRDAMRST